jgi:hypothetical protein
MDEGAAVGRSVQFSVFSQRRGSHRGKPSSDILFHRRLIQLSHSGLIPPVGDPATWLPLRASLFGRRGVLSSPPPPVRSARFSLWREQRPLTEAREARRGGARRAPDDVSLVTCGEFEKNGT